MLAFPPRPEKENFTSEAAFQNAFKIYDREVKRIKKKAWDFSRIFGIKI